MADRAKISGTLETIVIGAAGGLLFLWLNLPGGLISGAMVAVGIAALAGRPVTMPPVLRANLPPGSVVRFVGWMQRPPQDVSLATDSIVVD